MHKTNQQSPPPQTHLPTLKKNKKKPKTPLQEQINKQNQKGNQKKQCAGFEPGAKNHPTRVAKLWDQEMAKHQTDGGAVRYYRHRYLSTYVR